MRTGCHTEVRSDELLTEQRRKTDAVGLPPPPTPEAQPAAASTALGPPDLAAAPASPTDHVALQKGVREPRCYHEEVYRSVWKHWNRPIRFQEGKKCRSLQATN
jgi:hypothetical protein